MSQSQKKTVVIVIAAIAVVAAVYSFMMSGASPREEVVGTLPQLSKSEEKAAADKAAMPTDDLTIKTALGKGMDPADAEGAKPTKG